MQYPEAAAIAGELTAYLRTHCSVDRIEIAGSFRRRRKTVGDLDILAASKDAKSVIDGFLRFPAATRQLGAGDTKASIIVGNHSPLSCRKRP